MYVIILVFLHHHFPIIFQQIVIAGDITSTNMLIAQVNETSNIANLVELIDLWKETEIKQTKLFIR